MSDPRQFDLTTPIPETHTFVQWKGTDVCLDFHCECGHHGHFDGYFAYHLKCTACGAVYQMPANLFPRKLTPEEVAKAHCIQEPGDE